MVVARNKIKGLVSREITESRAIADSRATLPAEVGADEVEAEIEIQALAPNRIGDTQPSGPTTPLS